MPLRRHGFKQQRIRLCLCLCLCLCLRLRLCLPYPYLLHWLKTGIPVRKILLILCGLSTPDSPIAQTMGATD